MAEELLEPVLMVNPVVDPKVSLPFATESVNESDVPDATESVTLIELENVRIPFSFTLADDGAVIVGGGKLPTVIATFPNPLRPSPESLSEICSESPPV